MDWIQAAFPRARLGPTIEEYVRIRHPLNARAADDPLFRRVPEDSLFLDLETLGFQGHPLFLIGLLRRGPRPGKWEVLQLLARDYTEEEAVIRSFAEEGSLRRRWVSFNGKCFDVPFLRRRAAFYGLRVGDPACHIDLLPLARKLYKGVLPNCRLQTLEKHVFGRYRLRDLGGSEIPAAYHAFVRTGDPEAMQRILLHNRDDLVSLARLAVHLEEE